MNSGTISGTFTVSKHLVKTFIIDENDKSRNVFNLVSHDI